MCSYRPLTFLSPVPPPPLLFCVCLFAYSPGVFLWNHLLRASQKDAGGHGVGLRPGEVQWFHWWVAATEKGLRCWLWCSLLLAPTEALSVICRGVSDILSWNELHTLFSLCNWTHYVVSCSVCYAGIFKSQHICCYTSQRANPSFPVCIFICSKVFTRNKSKMQCN